MLPNLPLRPIALAALSFSLAAGVLFAGEPPASCTGGHNGCEMQSNLLVFAEGDGTYEIVAEITACESCEDTPVGFTLQGDAIIHWGPYDPGLGSDCTAGNDQTYLFLSGQVITTGAGGGGPGGDEETYVPHDPIDLFSFDSFTPLKTACVAADHLHYEIPWGIKLNGGDGATSGDLLSGDNAWFDLPEPVRAEEGGALITRLQIDEFRLTQALGFTTTENETPASTLLFWPDGLPFKLGPYAVTYTEAEVSFTTDSALGPTPYAVTRPDASPATGLVASQIRTCGNPEAGETCASGSIWNAGYFDHASWTPSGASFGIQGMNVDLDLESVHSIVYETLFPSRSAVKLAGPAHIDIEQGAITGGWFDSGTTWLQGLEELCEGYPSNGRKHLLDNGDHRPELGEDGALLAAVVDLNDNLHAGSDSEIIWASSQAESLGCGTLYAPPPLTAGLPQQTWLASAVSTTLLRGVYAGLNYNRNRICQDSVGGRLEKFCNVDTDCNTGAGESCVDGGFSPRCPELAPATPPRWSIRFEGETLDFDVTPDDPANSDREIAFVLRNSGVTGVFDGGDSGLTVGGGSTFELGLDSFGTAFRFSHSEYGDTIVQGDLVLPWPSDTDVPFEDMLVCTCGSAKSASAPESLIVRELAYWDATFFPHGLQFSSTNPDACKTPATNSCSQGGVSSYVCISALNPVPRFAPDIETVFDVNPTGQVGNMVPTSITRLDFDEDRDATDGLQDPYVFDVEDFTFSNWVDAGSPLRGDVIPASGSGTADFGYIDAFGEISLPYFGLTEAGIKVERERHPGPNHLVDMHNACEDGNPYVLCAENVLSAFVATRTIAGGTVEIPFLVDYIQPGATSDPLDGTDESGRGRGTLFAYPRDCDLTTHSCTIDLGSAQVASSLMMKPGEIVGGDGDLGPAAAMRLWGNLNGDSKALLSTIMPTQIAGLGSQYESALARLGLTGAQGHQLPPPTVLQGNMHQSGAIDDLIAHPDASALFNFEATGPNPSPPVNGSKITGYLDIAGDYSQIDFILLSSNLDTEGEFFAMDASLLTVDRHVKSVQEGGEPITTFTRKETPGASNNMDMSGEQSVPFPSGGSKSGASPFEWDMDFDMPGFQFKSLTGTLDLTKGGLSGVGFDRLGATMKFWNDGDWYFTAGMDGNFNGYGVKGDLLLGNTVDMSPLKDLDSTVASFLGGVSKFDGVYVRAGLHARIFDYGCAFRVTAGTEVAGWYMSQSFGGKVRGWLSGRGACVVSIRGDMTLMGAYTNDLFTIGGNFWVAGGIGFCDEEDWDAPCDVLDDGGCAACVAELSATGSYPPDDLNLQVNGPNFSCAGPF